jgi:hypothetical protein
MIMIVSCGLVCAIISFGYLIFTSVKYLKRKCCKPKDAKVNVKNPTTIDLKHSQNVSDTTNQPNVNFEEEPKTLEDYQRLAIKRHEEQKIKNRYLISRKENK